MTGRIAETPRSLLLVVESDSPARVLLAPPSDQSVF
jgi:hypothetical protein